MAIIMSNESDPYTTQQQQPPPPPPPPSHGHGNPPVWSSTPNSAVYNTAPVIRRAAATSPLSGGYEYSSDYSRRPTDSTAEAPSTTYHGLPAEQPHYMTTPAQQPYPINTTLHLGSHLTPTPSPQNLLSSVSLGQHSPASPLPALEGENTLQPTWRGFVHTAWDAALVVEACLDGTLIHCPRRPHDRERQHVIRSGSIFVYEALASGIKRWTDGLTWSPSRINGNFLVYRELNDNVQQGSKRRTAKRSRLTNSRESSSTNLNGSFTETTARATTNEDRPYIGSLSDSYDFKPGGLVKKTISFSVNNNTHHVICYYTLDEAKSGVLLRPQQDPTLAYKDPRPELREPRNFKAGPHHPDDNMFYHMTPIPQSAAAYAQYYPGQAPPGYMVQQPYAPVSMPVQHSGIAPPQSQHYTHDEQQQPIRYDGYT